MFMAYGRFGLMLCSNLNTVRARIMLYTLLAKKNHINHFMIIFFFRFVGEKENMETLETEDKSVHFTGNMAQNIN